MILLCNISCSVLNGSVDCTDGDELQDRFGSEMVYRIYYI